ncbi:MAG: response regulator [Kofleriaceae bacterium]
MTTERGVVLLVDDDYDVREVYAEALTESGFDVATAPNGRDALQYLERTSQVPSVILVDLMMPVMSGKEFVEELRRRDAFQNTSIVVMTASRTLPSIDGTTHLYKPFSLESLCEAVRRSMTAHDRAIAT